MVSERSGPNNLALQRLQDASDHTFTTPSKKINDGDDLTFFLSSTAYRDLMTWLLQLNRSMFPAQDANGKISQSKLTSLPQLSQRVQSLRILIADLSDLVQKAPPDTGPRRFGNVAFKAWFKLAEENAGGLLDSHLGDVLGKYEQQVQSLKDELKFYLLGSFGSSQRLDYGTGHELSFLAFLGCLWKLGAFEDGEERAIVMGVVQPYLELIRHLVLTYTLEPAGSHGVWGLDDHSFIPYIFGSAQYGPAISPSQPATNIPTEGSMKTAPSPSKITDKQVVADYKDMNMYFSAIQFIYDVKKGPFWEHSPVLYDVSGIKDGWAKINKGMLKMYAAEVLGKFPVVQHFGFGSLFAWEVDPEASGSGKSMHAQQQPEKARSMDVPPAPPPGAGTKAPWAKSGGSSQMPASTGFASTRAPWTGGGVATRPPPPPGSGMIHTTAPWAASQRQQSSQPGVTSTTAPWASTQRAPPGNTGRPFASSPGKDRS